MSKRKNRQTSRSKRLLQEALQELLQEKPYHKIIISEITERADLARSTFYTHYETKDDLLKGFVDRILDKFFDELRARDMSTPNPERDLEININIFREFQKNAAVIQSLGDLDIDCLLIDRYKAYWTERIDELAASGKIKMTPNLANYIKTFLAYSFVGIIQQWMEEDLKQSPESMGNLLYTLTGPPALNHAREVVGDLFP